MLRKVAQPGWRSHPRRAIEIRHSWGKRARSDNENQTFVGGIGNSVGDRRGPRARTERAPRSPRAGGPAAGAGGGENRTRGPPRGPRGGGAGAPAPPAGAPPGRAPGDARRGGGGGG